MILLRILVVLTWGISRIFKRAGLLPPMESEAAAEGRLNDTLTNKIPPGAWDAAMGRPSKDDSPYHFEAE